MFKSVFFIAVCALFGATLPAQAEDTCDMYFVQQGDTLRLIAEQYYGARELSPLIYAANADIVGNDPNIIEIGMALDIPCREGISMPASVSFLNIDQTADMPVNAHFLSRSGTDPFVDARNSGIVTRILFASLRRGGFGSGLDVVQTQSTTAMFEAAAKNDALLSFPWIKPDCESGTGISAQAANLCANYAFSKPLYEITLGLFTTEHSRLGNNPPLAALENSRICSADLYGQGLLQQIGLVNNAALQAPSAATNAECVAGLLRGDYDVILSDYQSIGALPPEQAALISDMPAFASKTTLHAIAYSRNQAALTALSLANRGLTEILTSGEWFDIVSQGLAHPNGS
jgi:hypothetical protein